MWGVTEQWLQRGGQRHPPAVAVGQRGGGNALFFKFKEFFWLPSNCCPGFGAGGKRGIPRELGGGGGMEILWL